MNSICHDFHKIKKVFTYFYDISEIFFMMVDHGSLPADMKNVCH